MPKFLVYDINYGDIMYEGALTLQEAQRYVQDYFDNESGYCVRDLVIYQLVVEDK